MGTDVSPVMCSCVCSVCPGVSRTGTDFLSVTSKVVGSFDCVEGVSVSGECTSVVVNYDSVTAKL